MLKEVQIADNALKISRLKFWNFLKYPEEFVTKWPVSPCMCMWDPDHDLYNDQITKKKKIFGYQLNNAHILP